VIVRAVQLIA